MQFKHEYSNQKSLGRLFDVSSHVIGKWLIEAALRDPRSKLPSHEAHRDGYCIQVPGGPSGQYTYHWHTQKTVARLLRSGKQLPLELPDDLILPPSLNPPFTVSSRDACCVVNGDGDVLARATDRKYATVIAKLLTAASNCAKLHSLLPPSLDRP